MTPELYHPVLDCFVCGMPYAYRHTDSPERTNVLLEISGECGGRWVLTKGFEGWHFVKESPKQVACKVLRLPVRSDSRGFTVSPVFVNPGPCPGRSVNTLQRINPWMASSRTIQRICERTSGFICLLRSTSFVLAVRLPAP